MSRKRLNVEKNTGYLFFRNPPLLQISTFSLGQKGCAYYEKSDYYECSAHCVLIMSGHSILNRSSRLTVDCDTAHVRNNVFQPTLARLFW